MSGARVIVVGAGVIGAATAMRLAEAGAQVTLLDAGAPGGGTSATTFSWVGASPLGLWDYFDINVAGMAAHRRLRAEFGAAPWYETSGSLVWFSAPEAGDRLRERVAQLRETGYSAALIGAGRARALEPAVNFGAAEQVAFYPDEGYVFPGRLVGELVRRARERGARTRWGARLAAIDERPGGVRVTLAGGETLDADRLVLCCGRWTGEVAALAGAELPMLAAERGSVSVGLLVLTTAIAAPLERVLIADELMIRPDGGGRLMLHSDEHDRLVDPVGGDRAAIATQVVDAAARHLDLPAPPSAAAAMVGVRALTADLLPAVGPLGGSARVYAAATHSGITMGPLLGELIASEVLTGAEEPLLAPFRPGRFVTVTHRAEERP
jgi:D-hydroxyproline dehydrogenase subunit beta